MAAVQLGTRRFDIGRVVERTFGVSSRNFLPFYLMTVVLSLPNMVANLVLQRTPGALPSATSIMLAGVAGLIGLVTSLLVQGALVWGTVADLNGRRASFSELMSHGLNRALPILGISIVLAFAVFAGMILLIVPGVILLIMWSVVVPVTVVERPPGLGALGRSAALTRGSRWAIFGLAIIYVIAASVFSGVAGALGIMLGSRQLMIIVISLINGVAVMVGAVGGAVLYSELRASKEGVEPETLAAVFD